MRLNNKICFITGAASGIGAATAEAFAAEGATVILSDRDVVRGKELIEKIKATGGNASFVELDVTDSTMWQDVESMLEKEYSGLDVMINNAGLGAMKSIEKLTLEDWRLLMSVNLDSVFIGTQMAIRLMKKQGAGSIINVSSIYAIVSESMAPAYSASKGGVRYFSKSVALFCAQENLNIRCNSLHPGFIETRIGENGLMDLSDEEMAAVQARIADGIAVGYQGSAKDIANGMVFLASDESKYMTGTELIIDGGYSAH